MTFTRSPREVRLTPDSSLAEVPWLLRHDFQNPQVQAEIKRQMALPEDEDGLLILAEIEQNQINLLKDL